MEEFLWIGVGLLLLALGGDVLVRGAVRVAEALGVSPLLIGLTLVGFGTSTPELVTSIEASMLGSPGIAIGNIVGSNIANILLILGLSALLAPIAVSGSALSRDGVLVVAVAVVLMMIGLEASLDRLAGAALVMGLVGYLTYAWFTERAQAGDHTAAFQKTEALQGVTTVGGGAHALWWPLMLAIVGLGLVVIGGSVLVEAAIGLARRYEVSESFIGLTIVAVGTSLPELVTSLVAAARRQSDVALGNILGSNIYNVLGIAGITGLIAPTTIPAEIVAFDAPVMVAASVLLLTFAWSGRIISRLEGGVLLALYCTYLWAIAPAGTFA